MIGRTNSTFGGAISLPDGSTATANDVQTWLKCAGINKSYTSVSQVVADTDTMFLLMSDENAMKYLARSTDFADTICADETSMTYLGQSAYVDSTILNSDLWKNTIKASQYWTLVYASKIVTVYGAASETITIEGYYNASFTTGTDGSCSHVVPIDTITLTGSVSGQSFKRTITSETIEVYVMPEGALYWYGVKKCNFIHGVMENNASLKRKITYNINNITANIVTENDWYSLFTARTPVNDNATKLKAIVSVTSVYSYFIGTSLGVYSSSSMGNTLKATEIPAIIGFYTIECDISNYGNTEQYIGFKLGSDSLTIHALWIE